MNSGDGWTETITLDALTGDEIVEQALLFATTPPTVVDLTTLDPRD